jgi:GTP pyrophosphokinase
MVQVTEKHDILQSRDEVSLDAWLPRIAAGRSAEDLALIRRAGELAQRAHRGQTRVSGEPYLHHVLAVAEILAELHLDAESIAAAILHDVVEDTEITLREVEAQFGPRVRALVDGVTKMAVIPEYTGPAGKGKGEQAQAESLRKMLLAMAEDVRVVLIKLADRLHNMRTLGALPETRRRAIAKETMDVFAPLANRLGIWQIKWELEDLAFRYLEPEQYRQIAGWLAERRVDRERYIEAFVATLRAELEKAGVRAEVTGRPKHIFSIWKKMRRKRSEFSKIYDVRAVRVLVDEVKDCYAALGIVHTLWPYVSGEFDDYIATPKENNYRSIHTAIVGPEGKTVEVQIRTHGMHRQSELGVAAHWRYKEGAGRDESFEQKIAWLRTLLEWKDEVADAGEFVDQFKSEVFEDRVYVFTPKGRIVDLPAGSTPLDFAYHIHTEVGHRCRGAKVNGRIVPLTYRLHTGEQVEILTVKKGGPSRDWLNADLGYLATTKARAKVQTWFRQLNREANIADGRAALERDLKRLGLADANYERLAESLGFRKPDDLLAAVGRGEIKTSQIAAAAPAEQAERAAPEAPPITVRHAPQEARPTAIRIQGVGNLLTHVARCCNPLPGDSIIGYITQGRGVTIHRRDCRNVLRYQSGDESRARLVEVAWGEQAARTYPVDVEVVAYDRHGLLHDVTAILSNAKINVTAVNTASDKARNVARMVLTLEIPNLGTLSRVLAQINQLPNVTGVRRLTR